MSRRFHSLAAAGALVFLGLVLPRPSFVEGAQNDNNVEWNGVLSLPSWRSPQWPGVNESFRVDLRVFKGDITAARVRTWDGAERFHGMAWSHGDGTYDYWRATVSGTSSSYLYYWFEIRDGTDVDYYNALGMWSDPPPRGDFLINTTPLGAFPLGANIDGAGAVFRVWAPNASSAAVAGTFNGWSTTANPMSRVQGFWQVRIPAAPAGSRYKFVFGGGAIWRTDPYSRAQVNSIGDSILAPRSYLWGDSGWVPPALEDLVIYELHVGSFSGDGDGVTHSPGRYRDVVDRHLDHLLELGINAIELLPVGEFAGDRSWGYNPAFLFAPESIYGSPDDLKYLVDRCHQNGIAVILDVVYNHMGPGDLAGNLLEYDGTEIYFYPPGHRHRETPWGPRPDYGRVEVRNFIRDNVRYWLGEMRFDGLRIDATDFIKVNADGWELLKDIANAADEVSRRRIIIAEQLPNDPAVTRPIALGGAGLDAQWNDLFHDSLRAALGAAAFGDPDVSAVAAGMNHFGYAGTQVVNYIESHDEAAHQGRTPVVADSSNPRSVWAYGRSKLAFALVMFTAGIPMVLQGQEFLESRPFGDSEDRRIQWANKTRHADFFLAARDMVRLRRRLPALRANAGQFIYHVNESANVIAWRRWAGPGDDLVLIASFNNNDFEVYELGLPLPGEWFEIFNSDAAAYGGRNRGNGGRVEARGGPMHGLAHSAALTIPRMGALVLARAPLPPERAGFLRGDCNGDGLFDLSDPIRHLLHLFAGLGGKDCAAACDSNGDGREDIADALYALAHILLGGPAPPAPWPACAEHAAGPGCNRRCGQ